jgi:hypothetical protein
MQPAKKRQKADRTDSLPAEKFRIFLIALLLKRFFTYRLGALPSGEDVLFLDYFQELR